jgi:hypothetical protein
MNGYSTENTLEEGDGQWLFPDLQVGSPGK